MRFPPYPGYKSSDVEWLGDVPAHWDVKRLKYLAPRSDEKVEADEESPLPYIGLEHIEPWTGHLLALDPDLNPTGISNRFRGSDVLFGKLRPYLAKACCPDFEGLCSSELLVLRPLDQDRRSLLYRLLTQGFISLVDASTYGVKMPRASWEFIGSQGLPTPPESEQRAIADFLEIRTARIDSLVAKKRELIEKLEEKRAALISHTVTRGLPPEAARAAGLHPHPKLKPSGIKWLGHVPAHWDTRAMRRLIARLDQGWSPNAAAWPADEEEWGVLKLSAVRHGLFLPSENKALADEQVGSSVVTPRAGDLLLSRANTPDRVGDVCLVPSDYPRLLVPDLLYRIKLNPEVALASYVCLFLLSREGRSQIEADARGSSGSMVKVSQDHVFSWRIPCPPIPEQQAIADYLDRETRKIENLAVNVRSAIDCLLEYRSALITAAVTGKIDVRGVQDTPTESGGTLQP
jgi:type I restriction enzyme S subunit